MTSESPASGQHTEQTVSAVEEARNWAVKCAGGDHEVMCEDGCSFCDALARFEEAVRADARRDLETALRAIWNGQAIDLLDAAEIAHHALIGKRGADATPSPDGTVEQHHLVCVLSDCGRPLRWKAHWTDEGRWATNDCPVHGAVEDFLRIPKRPSLDGRAAVSVEIVGGEQR